MSVSSNIPKVTKTQVNTEVDNALNTAIPGSPASDSINERIATMDGLIYTMNSRITGTVSTLTAQNVEDEAEDGALTALNTEISGSNTADSVNDILHDQLKPRLPGSGTISTLTAANIEDQCDNSLNNAISSPAANSAAGILEQLNKGTKVDFKEAYANILLGTAGSSGYTSIVDVDNKVGSLTSIDIYVPNATAGQQAGAYATLSVALSGGTADTIELCYNGSFQINWLIHRDGISTAAAGAGDHARYHFNQPFISTTNSLNVGVTVTPGSAGGEMFVRVMYAIEI